MADELRIHVGGLVFSGWKEIAIARSLEAVAGVFQVVSRDREPWPLTPGTSVDVRLGRERLLRGYVDSLSATLRGRDLTAIGRDRTADLVDASATPPAEWWNVRIFELVADIAAPFGISTSLAGDVEDQGEPFQRFAVEPGERAWSGIERALRLRGLMAYTNGDGSLILSRPAARRVGTSLEEGRNILDAQFAWDHAERFQAYLLRGQRMGSDDEAGELVAQVEARATDPEIQRYRPLEILAEGMVSDQAAQDRIEWEAAVRAARSARLRVTCAGWRPAPGFRPWQVNSLVRVRIPTFRLDQDLLINRVDLSHGEDGRKTELELVRADAYTRQPAVPDANPFGMFAGDSE